MADEQFLTSSNVEESLFVIRSYFIDAVNSLCKEIGIDTIIDFSSPPILVVDKGNTEKAFQYFNLKAMCECIAIIDEKLEK